MTPVLRVPLAANAPLQPSAPEQDVALLEVHVSVDVPPDAMTEGFKVSVAVGMILTVAVAGALLPPAPIQTSEYAAAVLRGPVL
jgi:hypothetical protein